MSILSKFLKKTGVREYSELSDSEKETYQEWEEVLSGRKITDDDVKLFFDTELDDIQVKIVNPNNSQREDIFLKMKLELLRKLKVFLLAPENERRMLEQNINNLLKQ
jgi:hypothetical protein